eukprot:GHVU01211075.1.p1 GENE.GHVU01211075.1~~GHVU01211075.1.p1  ORF type:complete len:121 (-),score=15.79 GHVU01211075.1:195-557(-)
MGYVGSRTGQKATAAAERATAEREEDAERTRASAAVAAPTTNESTNGWSPSPMHPFSLSRTHRDYAVGQSGNHQSAISHARSPARPHARTLVPSLARRASSASSVHLDINMKTGPSSHRE